MINFEEHTGLVHHVYNKYYNIVGELLQLKDDFIQEGLIALYKSSLTFDENNGTAFATYAYHQIHGAMSNFNRLIQGRSEGKKKFLKETMSLDVKIKDIEETHVSNITYKRNEYKDLITKIDLESAINDIPVIAKKIINYIVNGYTYSEIAKKFNMTTQGVYYYKRQYSKTIKQNMLA